MKSLSEALSRREVNGSPVKVDGSDAEKSLAFQQAYGTLRNRMLGFTSLPLTSLDRISLQKALEASRASLDELHRQLSSVVGSDADDDVRRSDAHSRV